MASELEMERLGMLPCPFCGDFPCLADNETKEQYADTWFVICEECGAKGPAEYDGSGDWQPATRTKQECMDAAVRCWNRRTPDATHLREVNAALVEALREAQSALALMVSPDAIRQSTVSHAFAQATAAEAKARAALARATTQEQAP